MLTDDETAPGATLALSDNLIPEGGTSVVSATLSGASGAATTVTVTQVPGFYTVGSDAIIVIAMGATAAASDTVTITAVDNATDEPNRMTTVTGTLANAVGAGSVTGEALTLEDDDAAPTVTLAVSSTSITENGGQAMVSATLSNPSSAVTTVRITAMTGVYTVGAGAAGTIVIAAGQTANTADVATITAVDNAVDAAENMVMVAGTAQNSHGVGTVNEAPLTITDDDEAAIVLSAGATETARVRTSEDGSTAEVAVSLATQPTGNVVMNVASSDTAQGTVLPAALTFTATTWNTAQPVTLTGVDDNPDLPDGSQTYQVTLTVDIGNTADANYNGLAAVFIYAINADDELGLEVGPVMGQATEAGGTATVHREVGDGSRGSHGAVADGDRVGVQPGPRRGHGVADVADLHRGGLGQLEHLPDGDRDRGRRRH